MKGKTHSTEEIIRILRQADGGETAQSVCREHNISEQTFYRWKKKYGDMELADAKRLKALEKENAELKMMTLLDEYTRQSLAIQVERQLTATQVLAVLEKAMARYGVPGYIRSDNGPEFIAAKVQHWLSENQIKTIYIDPGSPWQNGYIESFHSRFRDECLGREMFLNLREARVVISDWRLHYNQERPHSKLGYRSPNEFINTKTLTS